MAWIEKRDGAQRTYRVVWRAPDDPGRRMSSPAFDTEAEARRYRAVV